MTQLEKFAQLANQLAQEEPKVQEESPIPWFASQYTGGIYLCRDNGGGYGRKFTDRESKRQHQLWCKHVTHRESERYVSTTRLMGG